MSLIAEYGFTEGAGGTSADSSGNGHTATVAGWTASGHTGAAALGVAGNAARTSDSFGVPTAFTIMQWMYPTATGDITIGWQDRSTGIDAFGIGWSDSTHLTCWAYGSALAQPVASVTTALNAWVHVAMSVGAGTVTLIINGVARGTATYSGTLRGAVTGIDIGGTTVWGDSAALGRFDDVRYFDTALTAAQVTTWMNTPAGGANSGSISTAVPKVTAALSGTTVNAGTLAGITPKITGAVAGQQANNATMAVRTPAVTGAASGASVNTGALTGAIPATKASITGQSVNAAAIASSTPAVTAAVPGTLTNPGALNVATPPVTGDIVGQQVNPGAITGSTRPTTAAVAGTLTNAGALAAAVPPVTVTIADQSTNPGILTATVPNVTAQVTGSSGNPGTFAVGTPPATASLPGVLVIPGSLTAAVPAVTGAVAGVQSCPASLTGVLPLIRVIITTGGDPPPARPTQRYLIDVTPPRTLTSTAIRSLANATPPRTLKEMP